MSMDDETHGTEANFWAFEPVDNWPWLAFSKHCREPISGRCSDAAVNRAALGHLGMATLRQDKPLLDVSRALAGRGEELDLSRPAGKPPIFSGQWQEATLDLHV